jgi:Flp pilus assembly protein TadD
MSSQRNAQPKRKAKWLLPVLIALPLLIVGAAIFWFWPERPDAIPGTPAATPVAGEDAAIFAAYGTSPTCKSCHEEEFQNWENSHHALAERAIDPAIDAEAFQPHYKIRHGSQVSEVRASNGRFEIVTEGLEGRQPFPVERVIGVSPLRQFLIPAPGGRFQVSELAYDPHHPDWFNVFGDEDRRPGEWGAWTGRGMNWNSMCGTCHNTRYRKNYDARTDSFATTMAERGIGCEACHGPMADHNEWQAKHPNQSGDPTIRRITREEMFSTCAQCHSRRAELTGDFRPGENFFDHHALSIPDETDLFYADGQVRDEDFEYTAFLGSKMYAAGVRCNDCHEPHTSKVRTGGNYMCLVCHFGPVPEPVDPLTTQPLGPRIDPETHSRHKVGERGDFCIDCHMPQTVYMERHSRHDHGFTTPDPRLTIDFGIPNACNRCHTERSAEWALDYMEQWYGPRTNNTVYHRADAITKARQGDDAAVPGLLRMAREEPIPMWRAVAVNLLRRWSGRPEVTSVLLSAASDTNELVRAMAVRSLETLTQFGDARVRKVLDTRLSDPVRSVRIDAAWALRALIETNSPAGTDLMNYLRFNADQPSGVLQFGVFHLDRGETDVAMEHFQRAVKWDPNSAPFHHALAIGLSLEGKTDEAVKALRTACELAPENPEYRFKLGLALNEAGKLAEARRALEEAVKLDPQYAQAWYNLGLAHNALGNATLALDALLRAESIDAQSAQIPYARATILARMGRIEEARTAARRALEIQPGHGDAAGLLRMLSR